MAHLANWQRLMGLPVLVRPHWRRTRHCYHSELKQPQKTSSLRELIFFNLLEYKLVVTVAVSMFLCISVFHHMGFTPTRIGGATLPGAICGIRICMMTVPGRMPCQFQLCQATIQTIYGMSLGYMRSWFGILMETSTTLYTVELDLRTVLYNELCELLIMKAANQLIRYCFNLLL